MIQQIVFIIISAATLGMAWMVVTNRNLFHAALALMATFLGVAGLYVMLDAGFLAAAQLLVYIGAISILVIFAIMMTRRLMQTTETSFNTQWGIGAIMSLFVFIVIAVVVTQYWPLEPGEEPFAMAPAASGTVINSSVEQLGVSLVNIDQYVLPFELASVLLLAALIGSIVIAWPEKNITGED